MTPDAPTRQRAVAIHFLFRRARYTVTAGVAFAAAAAGAGRAAAQPAAAAARTADSLAGITTDTGAFAPGDRDFAHYIVPTMCVATVRRAASAARRTVAAQLMVARLRDSAPDRNTLPGSVVDIARRCARRFTVAETDLEELTALLQLALQAGDDTLARAVVRRQMALAPNAAGRQEVLAVAADTAAASTPVRRDFAVWATTTADSLALAEHTSSLDAHLSLLWLAERAFDVPRMMREASAVIALGDKLDFNAIKDRYSALTLAWRHLAQMAYYARGERVDTVMTVVRAAKAYMGRRPFVIEPLSALMSFDFERHTAEETRDFLIKWNPEQYAGDRALPPVAASYWYPAKPAEWPPRGVVSLVFYGGGIMGCARTDYVLLGVDLGGGNACWTFHAYLRDWATAYAPQGLALTFVERGGAVSGEAVRSVPLTPRQEADTLAWFYQTYLGLPGARVAVVPKALEFEAPHPGDARRWEADTTAFGRLITSMGGGDQNGIYMLYGRDGQLLYLNRGGDELPRAFIQSLIVQALASPTFPTPPTPR